ncbi:DNA-3-methyladenine glycosylase I [Actibacterium pelagium]|nr:DNA-3-methyladenine glycosylase I [Actibacterium pelagium]
MKTYAELLDIATKRKGEEFLADHLTVSEVSLADLTDDRILSEFSRGVFQAGFSWKVIDNKWPGFEEAFERFDIARNAFMSDEDLDRHLANKAIVRNAQKILSIRDNAIFLSDLAQAHGSAASFFAAWPSTDAVGLYDLIKTRGSRLGGMTGPYSLRRLGYDGVIFSKSVVSALNMAGAVDGAVTSKTAMRKAQEAINTWAEESGQPHAVISRVLAFSVPD